MKVVSIWARAFGEGIRVTLESRQQSPSSVQSVAPPTQTSNMLIWVFRIGAKASLALVMTRFLHCPLLSVQQQALPPSLFASPQAAGSWQIPLSSARRVAR